MCHSITYYFSECLCTYRIGWYTCHQAGVYLLSAPNHTDEAIDVADDEAGISSRRRHHAPVHENCARFSYTTQMKKCGDARCVECVSSEGGADGDADSAEGNVGSASDDDGDGVMVPPLKMQRGMRSGKAVKGKESVEERLAKFGIFPDGPAAVLKENTAGKTRPRTGAGTGTERNAEIKKLASAEVKPLTPSKKSATSDLMSKLSSTNADKATGSAILGLSSDVKALGNSEKRPCSGRVGSGGGGAVRGTGDPVKKSFTSSIPVRSSSLIGGAVGAGSANDGRDDGDGDGLTLNVGAGLEIKRAKTARGMRVERESRRQRDVERGYEGDTEGDASIEEVRNLSYASGSGGGSGGREG